MTSAACELVARKAASASRRRWIAFSERDATIWRLRRGCLNIVFGEADPPKIDITLWRRGSRRRRRRALIQIRRWRRRGAKIKLHRRRFLRARLRCEKWPRRKTKYSCNQVCRKTADRHVVVLHCSVEVAALDRDPVLRAFQLRLQTDKILISF